MLEEGVGRRGTTRQIDICAVLEAVNVAYGRIDLTRNEFLHFDLCLSRCWFKKRFERFYQIPIRLCICNHDLFLNV